MKHNGIGSGGQFVCSNEKDKDAAEKNTGQNRIFVDHKRDFLMAHEEDIDSGRNKAAHAGDNHGVPW